jgi:hypothetical protein
MPSFGGIKRDCDSIVSELKSQLKSKLSNNETSPAEMSECVNLLLQLVIFKFVFNKISFYKTHKLWGGGLLSGIYLPIFPLF